MEFVVAYIDPGSGSLLIQALIAGLVAIPIFFRHQIARAIRAVRRPSPEHPDTAVARDDTTPGA